MAKDFSKASPWPRKSSHLNFSSKIDKVLEKFENCVRHRRISQRTASVTVKTIYQSFKIVRVIPQYLYTHFTNSKYVRVRYCKKNNNNTLALFIFNARRK